MDGRELAEGLDDPLAVFRLLDRALANLPPLSEARVDRYRALTADQASRLAARALYLFDATIPDAAEAAESVLMYLACLVPGSLGAVQAKLASRGVFYPGFLYRGADTETRDLLVEAITSDEIGSQHRSHLLEALAWIGDEGVRALFASWRQTPPAWRGELYIPPEEYAPEGGWHLAPDGSRRDLCRDACRRLVPVGERHHGERPVRVIAPHEQQCGWCGRPLVSLLDLDLTAPELAFLGLAGVRLRIATCQRCTAYAPIFTEVDLHAGSRWSALNVRPEYLGPDDDEWQGLPQGALVLGPERRTPIEGIVLLWKSVGGVSQVGGHPTWEQDAEYPECPRCTGCLIAATTYQQM